MTLDEASVDRDLEVEDLTGPEGRVLLYEDRSVVIEVDTSAGLVEGFTTSRYGVTTSETLVDVLAAVLTDEDAEAMVTVSTGSLPDSVALLDPETPTRGQVLHVDVVTCDGVTGEVMDQRLATFDADALEPILRGGGGVMRKRIADDDDATADEEACDDRERERALSAELDLDLQVERPARHRLSRARLQPGILVLPVPEPPCACPCPSPP